MINPPHELEPPGPIPPRARRLLQEPPRSQMLAVALCCFAVSVVGLIILFAGLLS